MMYVGSSDQRGRPRSISATPRCPYRRKKSVRPLCSFGGSDPSRYSSARRSGGVSPRILALSGSERASLASAQSARSISVVGLCGSARIATRRSSSVARSPRSLPARALAARPATKTGGTLGSISGGPSRSSRSAATRRPVAPASGDVSPDVPNRATTRAALALALSGRASASAKRSGSRPRANARSRVRKIGHRLVGTVARRGSFTSCRTMGTVLASMFLMNRSKSRRPRSLRSTGVTSRNIRPADSMKNAAPL